MSGKQRSAVSGQRSMVGCQLSDLDQRSKINDQRSAAGFSLLELMISMFIMIILLSVALPTYQRSVQHAKEVVLQENLWQMRKAIDQYASDKGKFPESIDNLVEGKYLREMPIDPILDKAEWDAVMGEDPLTPDAPSGLKDVKSLAEGQDSNGKAYKEY